MNYVFKHRVRGKIKGYNGPTFLIDFDESESIRLPLLYQMISSYLGVDLLTDIVISSVDIKRVTENDNE